MVDLIAAFVTGLTAGGLSCLAVQGGLLTGSLTPATSKPARKSARRHRRSASVTARPILLFLMSKLVAYAVLGILLGALGSMLQLTPTLRALLMLAIGIFMVGNGLRMLNAHPIFRYFTFEPPRFVTRYLRRKAKDGVTAITPLFLGALTVLIPCGVTQVMMALAIGTGNPIQAAGLMVAFTLGSSVVFFAVAYLASQLGTATVHGFNYLAAVVLIVLGVVSVNQGLNLMSVPLTIAQPRGVAGSEVRPTPVAAPGEANLLTIAALPFGYEPEQLHARADVPTQVTFVSDRLYSCSRALIVPEWNIQTILPETGTFSFSLPPQAPGKVLNYSCSMGMYTGQIIFSP